MLQEERERVRAQKQTVSESAETDKVKISLERDAALAEARDTKQQLTAALADLSMAKADAQRALESSGNLQYALEAFQAEREAELGILEEQRLADQSAVQAAHATAVQALKEAHEAQTNQVQLAGDTAVKNVMEDVNSLESKVEVRGCARLYG